MKRGVLVMAYGSPNSLNEVEDYYTDIRRGRKPTPALLEELKDRYRAIGGASPLLMVTQAQADSLASALRGEIKVYVGMRHWTPWIREAVAEMKADGVTHAVGLVMAPHFSSMSIAKYIECVEKGIELTEADFKISYVESWHDQPLFIEALLEKIEDVQSKFPIKSDIHYIFTAHSLPERILQTGDPYQKQLLETCQLVADKLQTENWTFAFQSAGRTEEKWLGPDLVETIEGLRTEGVKSMLICSVGFITDHLEVLYDIDIEAKAKAQEMGIQLERAASLNAHPKLAELWSNLVEAKFNAT